MASHTSPGSECDTRTLFPRFERLDTFSAQLCGRRDHGMMRRLIFGSGLLLCGVIASCSDASAPTASLFIVVSLDTLHVGQNVVPPPITYRERLVSLGRPKIWVTMAEVEAEVTPGKWQLLVDPNNLYLQAALGDAAVPFTAGDLGGERTLYLPLVRFVAPTRYRLRQRYQLTAPDATLPTGEVLVATSNPFVVMP
jgi:hypothetical protein